MLSRKRQTLALRETPRWDKLQGIRRACARTGILNSGETSMARGWCLLAVLWIAPALPAQEASFIRENYTRRTARIPMRDGVHLHTIIYAPKDQSQTYPMLMRRSPYGSPPYDEGAMPGILGPNARYAKEKFIFVYQDVRGRFMSEGEFENMRPHRPKRTDPKEIDESTDTFDTIDWLVKHVANHNGKVGLWGVSYPGFYCSAGMIDAHAALKAVSPQAPIADWFFDDFNHHGAFFLSHAFNFLSAFGKPRPMPTTVKTVGFDYPTPDGYQFYLDAGTLKNLNAKHLKHEIAFWNKLTKHPNYDSFWQERNLLPHLKNVAPAVLVVGGWYDAEDLYGIFNTYQTVEKQNPGVTNTLVVGPWYHGAWASNDASQLGDIRFGANTAAFFQKDVELPFFKQYLKGEGDANLPEALMFETGRNKWERFGQWPPAELKKATWYLAAKQSLRKATEAGDAFDEFVSDPARPVPFTAAITPRMTREYMVDDQRFASRRPDVLIYQTGALDHEVTLAGPLDVTLEVSTTESDADWVVKVIDVYPEGYKDEAGKNLGGYQRMIRSEVIRGRFRDSYETPKPFEPNKRATVKVRLLDVLHTFKKDHRVMVQVCSSWFPLVDRNPQKYVPNIFEAEETDFTRATHRVYRGGRGGSRIEVGILPKNAGGR